MKVLKTTSRNSFIQICIQPNTKLLPYIKISCKITDKVSFKDSLGCTLLSLNPFFNKCKYRKIEIENCPLKDQTPDKGILDNKTSNSITLKNSPTYYKLFFAKKGFIISCYE